MREPTYAFEPIPGFPGLAFRIRLTGPVEPAGILALYGQVARLVTDGAMNTVLDRRDAQSHADVARFEQFFGHIRQLGIHRYRAVVLDRDPYRHHMAALAAAVALSVGIDAVIRHVLDNDRAVRLLQDLVAPR